MGVNMVGYGIADDEVVKKSSHQEIIRRCFKYECEYMKGLVDKETVERAEVIMENLNLSKEDRAVVLPARKAAEERRNASGNKDIPCCGSAILLKDETIITGKNSNLLNSVSSLILNSVKHLAGIPDNIHLLSPSIIESILSLKENLNEKTISLNLQETLIALSISATTNHAAKTAVEKLHYLEGCEMHSTYILPPGDEMELRKLGVNLTSDPVFPTKDLFVR